MESCGRRGGHGVIVARNVVYNEPQPDALLRIVPAAGGRTIMTADEIADSNAAIDLHDRLRAYRRTCG